MSYANSRGDYRIAYDDIGNILSKSDVGSYSYDPAQPNAVSSVVGVRNANYSYDANGNMTSGAGRTPGWTSYNKPSSISDGTDYSIFFYGPDRKRFKQVATTSTGSTTTIYIGGLYEKRITPTVTEYISYIQAGGQSIAVAITRSNGSSATNYLHRDHLCSVDTLTDQNGDVIERLSYDAFGKRRFEDWSANPSDSLLNTPHATARGFTDHEHLDAVKLVHMNGRVYDPIIGRFLSADPFVQFPESTQGFNRYTYVNNNPLSLVDPSGYLLSGLTDFITDNFDIFSAIFQIASGIASQNPQQIVQGTLMLGVAIQSRIGSNDGFGGGLVQSDGGIRANAIVGMASIASIQSMATSANASVPVPADAGGRQTRSVGETIVHGAIAGVANPNPPASRNGPTVLDGPSGYKNSGGEPNRTVTGPRESSQSTAESESPNGIVDSIQPAIANIDPLDIRLAIDEFALVAFDSLTVGLVFGDINSENLLFPRLEPFANAAGFVLGGVGVSAGARGLGAFATSQTGRNLIFATTVATAPTRIATGAATAAEIAAGQLGRVRVIEFVQRASRPPLRIQRTEVPFR